MDFFMKLGGTFICLWPALFATAYGQESCPANQAEPFKIELIRIGTDKVNDHGKVVNRIYGDVAVNNKNVGRFFENPARKIAVGSYRGILRYRSGHLFVQSSCGVIS